MSIDIVTRGYRKVNERTCDVGMIDLKVPNMDESSFISKKQKFMKFLLIMITSFSSSEDQTELLDKGADAYVVKPAAPDALLKPIEEKLVRNYLWQPIFPFFV